MNRTQACRTTEVAWPKDVAAAALAWSAGRELAWLDSCADVIGPPGLRPGRRSLLAIEPLAILEQFDGRPAHLRTAAGRVLDEHSSGWELWRRWHARLPRLESTPAGPGPGWIGYVGFEMARQLERLPASHRDDLGLPRLRMVLADRAIALDHESQRAWAVAAPAVREALGLRDDPTDCLARWSAAAASPPAEIETPPPRLQPPTPRETHAHAVRRAIEHIAAGDIYQVNLAHRLRLAGIADPLRAYARLRRINPAPYAALLRWDAVDGMRDVTNGAREAANAQTGGRLRCAVLRTAPHSLPYVPSLPYDCAAPGGSGQSCAALRGSARSCAILSVSPELFLELRGDGVRTSPIKGTRPRTGEPARDERYLRELLESEKEAAELAMIVDLHRNDLGRVCRPGTVRVAHARRTEAHPSVFHTVADITGRLRPEHGALELLMAAFPAGSISGVPKIRAIEIIDELETCVRGGYTGCVGHVGLDGDMTMNVAIRTVQLNGTQAALYVGGGIVADSDPDAEYDETLAKARGILHGLGADPLGATEGQSPCGLRAARH